MFGVGTHKKKEAGGFFKNIPHIIAVDTDTSNGGA